MEKIFTTYIDDEPPEDDNAIDIKEAYKEQKKLLEKQMENLKTDLK